MRFQVLGSHYKDLDGLGLTDSWNLVTFLRVWIVIGNPDGGFALQSSQVLLTLKFLPIWKILLQFKNVKIQPNFCILLEQSWKN